MKTTRRRSTSSKLVLLGAALVVTAAGCGGSVSAIANDDGSDDGSRDGGADVVVDSGEGGIEAPELCERRAEQECAALEPCCHTANIAYDRAGCESRVRDECEEEMDRVRANERSFDGQAAEACLKETEVLFETCAFDSYEAFITATFWRPHDPCGRVFSGTVEQGGACKTANDCKAPADWARIAVCNGGQCASRPRVLAEGDDCINGLPTCGEGLFCDNSQDLTCQKTYAIGTPCGVFASEACGYDAICDGPTTRCRARLPIGEACDDDQDCASRRCEDDRCVPMTFASELACTGTKGSG